MWVLLFVSGFRARERENYRIGLKRMLKNQIYEIVFVFVCLFVVENTCGLWSVPLFVNYLPNRCYKGELCLSMAPSGVLSGEI